MAPKLGLLEGYFSYFEIQLWSHLGQVKSFSNDPKLLGHLDCVQTFSKNIVISNLKNFRAAYQYTIEDNWLKQGLSVKKTLYSAILHCKKTKRIELS